MEKKKLDKILSNTTIKRACCLGKGKSLSDDILEVPVRIPIPKKYDMDDEINIEDKEYFGYIDKNIKVPATMCPVGYKSNEKNDTTKCDDFYRLYCENSKHNYKKRVKKWNDLQFSIYRPDCRCFNRIPKFLNTPNMSPRCILKGCTLSNGLNGTTYLNKPAK